MMLLIVLIVALFTMIPLCVVSLVQRNLTWIDLGWFVAMGAGSVALALVTEGYGVRRAVVATLLAVWALRLAWHLVQNRIGKTEDGRYRDLRRRLVLPQIAYVPAMYLAEALIVPVCLLPVWVVMSMGRAFGTVWDFLGIVIWAVAVIGEAVADDQLERFRRMPSNAGRTCRIGLWRYSRHPNYFFEWVHWWAYPVFAIGSPLFALTLTGPVIMYVFLRYVTGIPHVERRSLMSRGREYLEYQRTTNMFIPWFPKRRGT